MTSLRRSWDTFNTICYNSDVIVWRFCDTFVTLLLQCVDVNECKSNPCGPGTRCVNQIGGFNCECASGRTGDPYSPTGCAASRLPPGGKITFFTPKATIRIPEGNGQAMFPPNIKNLSCRDFYSSYTELLKLPWKYVNFWYIEERTVY